MNPTPHQINELRARATELGLDIFDPASHFCQPRIPGYRQLSPEEGALMTEIKHHAEATRDLINKVTSVVSNVDEGDAPQSNVTNSMRWVNIAMTDLQKGYMALVRAVARPTGF